MADGDDREFELESRQAAGLYPIGRVLRATYNAENHASLGGDLTGLMLELARVDDAAPPPPAPPLPAQQIEPPVSWFGRLFGMTRA